MKAKHILPRTAVVTGIVAGLAAGSAVGAAGTKPAVAVFNSYEYASSATGSDCNLKPGDYFSGRLTWPGAGRIGAVWRYQLNGPTGPQVKEVSYPKTPLAGMTSWSGKATAVVKPGGTPGEFTFDTTITYIDADDFVLVETNFFGNCKETKSASLVRE